MSNFGRNLALWVIIALLLVLLVSVFQPGSGQRGAQELAYSDFITDVDTGKVRSVVIQDHNVSGVFTDGTAFSTYTPDDPELVSRLTGKNVQVSAKSQDSDMSPLLRGIYESPGGSESLDVLMKYMYVDKSPLCEFRDPRLGD